MQRAGAIALVFLTPCAARCADDPLAYRDRGNRLEGREVIEVGAPTLEELSFTRGAALAASGPHESIRLTFYLPEDATVHISASELVAMKHYKMKSKQVHWPKGWNTFAPWDTATVIEPLAISAGNLGVLARVGTDQLGSGELAPIEVQPAKGAVDRAEYEFQFRANYDLKSVRYQIEDATTAEKMGAGELTDVLGGAPASIRFSLTGRRDGRYRLTLDCLYRGRKGGPQRNYLFVHRLSSPERP